jgi:hypothetical protein
MVLLTREQLEARMVALHRGSLELVSNLSLEGLLERIVSLAREQLTPVMRPGVLDERGVRAVIPVGMTPDVPRCLTRRSARPDRR